MPRDIKGKPDKGSTDTGKFTTLTLEGTDGQQGVYEVEGQFRYVQVSDENLSWPFEEREAAGTDPVSGADTFDFDGDGDGEFVVWTEDDSNDGTSGATHELLLIELKRKVQLDSFDVSSFRVTGLEQGESGTVNGYDKDGNLLYTESFVFGDANDNLSDDGTYEIATENIEAFDIYQFNIVADEGSTFYIDDIVIT